MEKFWCSQMHKCGLLISLRMLWWDCEASPVATTFLGDKKAAKSISS